MHAVHYFKQKISAIRKRISKTSLTITLQVKISVVHKPQIIKTLLHFYSSGVLAGIWPCGVITMLSELFVAESKSQVYASLHEYCRRNSAHLSSLSMSHTHV